MQLIYKDFNFSYSQMKSLNLLRTLRPKGLVSTKYVIYDLKNRVASTTWGEDTDIIIFIFDISFLSDFLHFIKSLVLSLSFLILL